MNAAPCAAYAASSGACDVSNRTSGGSASAFGAFTQRGGPTFDAVPCASTASTRYSYEAAAEMFASM